MEQQTAEWHEFRKKGIGSSDAAVIMGVSPWRSLHDLWCEKTGREYEKQDNWATARGNEMEPVARADYELRYGIDMPPAVVFFDKYPFMRASLDGYNQELGLVLEIKCPGKADHAVAEAGKIPEKYYAQVQHQLLVTGADEVHYYSYKNHVGVLVIVKPDLDYMADLFKREIAFWNEYVLKNVEPKGR
jgi:putative phage-type endonuclease